MPRKSVNQTSKTQLIKKTNFQSQGLLKDKSEVKKAGNKEKNAVHDNWTIDYAKIQLNKFTRDNKLKTVDYKYNITNEGFVAEASIYVPILRKSLAACGSGHDKQSSSTNCAISLVQQLYHLDIIEPFPGSIKKTRVIDFKKPYRVNVDPLILMKVHDVLQEFDIEPVVKNDVLIKNGTKTSLIYNQVFNEFNEIKSNTLKRIISWSPPQRNWNPWLAKEIDQNYLATATLDQLSKKLAKDKYFKIPDPLEWFNENIAMRSQLPIFAKRNDILNLINENKIAIIRGSTISGKTSQVCQFILDEYLKSDQGAYCNIICAQSNSISAINTAKTVAFERKEDLGLSVGYSVTYDDSILPRSHGAILFCTFDVLLYKLENGVHGISHIIVDEIQERCINSDILMAIFKDMTDFYSPLKVICMSASVNSDVFLKYFDCSSDIDVEEKLYPVKEYFIEDIVQMLNYQPTHYSNEYYENNNIINDQYEDNLNSCVSNKTYPSYVRSRVAMISENSADFNIIVELIKYIEEEINTPGTILIFLESWKLVPMLRSYLNKPGYFESSKLCILPLDSKFACGKQYKVMEPVPPGVRKVILTTSIAETSITVYDVVFVINCCKQVLNKIYSNSSNFERIWISKANMQQRRSRAGLVKNGICFHLCSKARYDKMDDYITPEIVYKPLQKVLLIIKLLKLGDVEKFLSKTIEPPPNDAVIKAQEMLKDMKCLGINDELTPLGYIIAKLGIEPHIGRMMVLGNILMQGDALTIITANHLNRKKTFMFDKSVTSKSHPQHSLSGNRCSDHLTFLNAFHKWQSINNLKNDTGIYCERNKLYEPSLTSIKNIMEQLKKQFINIGFPEICFERQSFDFGTTTTSRMHNDPILDLVTAILTIGFYPNVCYIEKNQKIFMTGENNAIIHRKSINMCHKMDFQSPFFVFANKKYTTLRSKLIICKELTMVTPIHLLLFGARKIEYIKDESMSYVHLDDWLSLKMDTVTASAIVALRPAIESLIEHVSKNPNSISKLSEKYIKLIYVLKELCNFKCGRFNPSLISFDQSDKPNNIKKFKKSFKKREIASKDNVEPNNKRKFEKTFDDDTSYNAIPLIDIPYPKRKGLRSHSSDAGFTKEAITEPDDQMVV